MNSDLANRIIDLAMDDSFIQWVKDNCPENGVQLFLQQGRNISEINNARALILSLDDNSENYPEQSVSNLLGRINSTIDDRDVKTGFSRRRIIYFTVASVAACFLVLFMFFPWTGNGHLNSAFAEKLNYDLPDGSNLVMNSDSDLDFNRHDFKSNRVLKLEGEAFFKVEKGSPFVVETRLGRVEVLGTSFNVYNRGNRFEVSCKTGKVKVTDKEEGSFVILSAGESCTLEDKQIKKIKKISDDSDWMKGIHHFEGIHISEVLDEMERQFNIQIESEILENDDHYYTGFFKEGDIGNAFETVLWPLNLKYRLTENGVYKIYSKD